jgi:uncharacterized protein
LGWPRRDAAAAPLGPDAGKNRFAGKATTMSQPNALRVSVADLRRPGATRDVEVVATGVGLPAEAVEVPADQPVRVRLHLERLSEGVVARGEISSAWRGLCSRCLQPVGNDVIVHADELFETEPIDGETYRLASDVIDLEPLVRDALALELPHAPLCDPDCRGLCPMCGTDRNRGTCDCGTDEPDPRWAALRSLDL